MTANEIAYFKQSDPNFPQLLKETFSCPGGLYFKGNKDLFNQKKKIAIVGTRKASRTGRIIAYQLAKELSRQNIIVVSGLASGIDRAAHEGSLKGLAKTIAILGHGLHIVYPAENKGLAHQIIENNGLLISEYQPGHAIAPHQFLERNRLISGLCQGIIIVEAPERSGALNTATHALDQNREVFVVPGSITDPNYIGSNSLIKQGACLITSAQDVLDVINFK
ncbi:TPA: DNA-protecting protein DprA [Patescibacteria group bacterium]|jgi:DNA processing protein|nr:DNA-protecting protein DprA [Patescibacteria group bacterium]|tara:strand:+ start:1230 stop:1895 length:666 start_codon:yes stop_codon:yes gene_type:complete